jgi:uncharacterized UPF0160 family protein
VKKTSPVLVTHDGNFHADECFAIAAIKLLIPVIKIIRTRDEKIIAKANLKVDVGNRYEVEKGCFDHHQGNTGQRENGIPYSSFGLIWKSFGVKICNGDERIAKIIDSSLVQKVDAEDCGFDLYEKKLERVVPLTISTIIKSYIPNWHEENQDYDAAFEKAVEFAGQFLKRNISYAEASVRSKEVVLKAIAETKDPRIIVLPVNCRPETLIMSRSDTALYVIYPAANGMWRVKAIPKGGKNFFEVRKMLPAKWVVEDNPKKLAAATGVKDALFCHEKRFMATAKSKEGAIKLAQLAANS